MAATESHNKGADFINRDQKEENRDHFSSGLKQGHMDPDLIAQGYCKIEIKEEIQDPDFIDQNQCNSGIKEENEAPDVTEQGHYKVEIKEENQDPDPIDQDPGKSGIKETNQDVDPAGSTDHEVSADGLIGFVTTSTSVEFPCVKVLFWF